MKKEVGTGSAGRCRPPIAKSDFSANFAAEADSARKKRNGKDGPMERPATLSELRLLRQKIIDSIKEERNAGALHDGRLRHAVDIIGGLGSAIRRAERRERLAQLQRDLARESNRCSTDAERRQKLARLARSGF